MERRVEARDVGNVGILRARSIDGRQCVGKMLRIQGHEGTKARHQRIRYERRLAVVAAAVHDAVPNGTHVLATTVGPEPAEDGVERATMVQKPFGVVERSAGTVEDAHAAPRRIDSVH
jgi:hypothetical protein